MNEREFDIILKEHFDTSDRRTMKTMLSLNEADQNQAMAALAAKLYNKIVEKVDDIDFGTIPASKGDITKIGNYQEMRDCMDTIRNILVHYKQETSQIDIIDKAIENLKSSKKIWEKAFIVESNLPITFYNTIALSIVSSVSLLITSSIDFIKEPGNNSFAISFDRAGYMKTKDKLLFQNLDKFNKSYASGDIEKLMNEIVKKTSNIKEAAELDPIDEATWTSFLLIEKILKVIGLTLMPVLISVVITLLHELTSILYCAKQNASEYFEAQAKIVQFNAEQLKYDYTKSDAEVKKIYDKQIKIADMFRKISSKLTVRMNKAESDAKKMIEKERKEKYKIDDLEAEDVPAFTSSIF